MYRSTLSRPLHSLSTPQSRREAIGVAGRVAAGAVLSSSVVPHLALADAAGDVEIGMHAFTILFPAGERIKFDIDYYRDKHMAIIERLYGNTIKRFELRKPIVVPGGPPSKYAAVINMWIPDTKAFAEASKEHGASLVKDKENFTNSMQIVQNDLVYGEAGMGAKAVKIGDPCLTILYPHVAGDHFDYDYYRDHHLTSIMKLYGSKAISRYEMRKGLANPIGSAPLPYSCTVNIYIADQQSFDEAGKMYQKTLAGDVPNFSSVNPVAIPTTVYGVVDS